MSNTNVLKKTLFLYPFCIKNKYFSRFSLIKWYLASLVLEITVPISMHLSNNSRDNYFYKGVVFLHGKVVSY